MNKYSYSFVIIIVSIRTLPFLLKMRKHTFSWAYFLLSAGLFTSFLSDANKAQAKNKVQVFYK